MTIAYQRERHLEQRIRFFDKIFSRTCMVGGLIVLVTQIIQIFIDRFSFSILFASLFSIFLFIFGYKQVLGTFIRFVFSDSRTFIFTRLLFLFPIFLTIFAVVIKLIVGNDSWSKMNTEGGLIEYGTSLAYILAFIFAIPIGKFFWQQEQKYLSLFYFAIALFFLLIGLEEISWGQRLIGLESPEFFQNYNSQDELTLHNLVWIKNYMDKACMILGLIGGMSWILIKKVKHNTTQYFVPNWFLSSSFLIVFSFFAASEYIKDFGLLIEYPGLKKSFLPFAEFVELLLSLGFLLFILTNFFRQSLEGHSRKLLVKQNS